MLLIYGHYKYFYFFSAGIDFICHNLTSKSIPALKELKIHRKNNVRRFYN